MSIRTEARSWLEGKTRLDSRLTRVLHDARWSPATNVLVSKVFAPQKSRTSRWSWWHKVAFDQLDGGGELILVCERRDGQGFHALAVPRAWLRDRRNRFPTFGLQPALNLMISAEDEDLLVDTKSGQSFAEWKVL